MIDSFDPLGPTHTGLCTHQVSLYPSATAPGTEGDIQLRLDHSASDHFACIHQGLGNPGNRTIQQTNYLPGTHAPIPGDPGSWSRPVCQRDSRCPEIHQRKTARGPPHRGGGRGQKENRSAQRQQDLTSDLPERSRRKHWSETLTPASAERKHCSENTDRGQCEALPKGKNTDPGGKHCPEAKTLTPSEFRALGRKHCP